MSVVELAEPSLGRPAARSWWYGPPRPTSSLLWSLVVAPDPGKYVLTVGRNTLQDQETFSPLPWRAR
jgi:hypothetical protein